MSTWFGMTATSGEGTDTEKQPTVSDTETHEFFEVGRGSGARDSGGGARTDLLRTTTTIDMGDPPTMKSGMNQGKGTKVSSSKTSKKKTVEFHQVCPSTKQNPVITFTVDDPRGMVLVGLASGAVDAFPIPQPVGGPVLVSEDESDRTRFLCRRLIDKDNESIRHIFVTEPSLPEDSDDDRKDGSEEDDDEDEDYSGPSGVGMPSVCTVVGDMLIRAFPKGYNEDSGGSVFPFMNHSHTKARECWSSQVVCRGAHVLLFPMQDPSDSGVGGSDPSSSSSSTTTDSSNRTSTFHYANLTWLGHRHGGIEQHTIVVTHANIPRPTKSAIDRPPSTMLLDFDGERVTYLHRLSDGTRYVGVLRLHIPYCRGLSDGPRQAVHVIKPGEWTFPKSNKHYWGFLLNGYNGSIAYVSNANVLKVWSIESRSLISKMSGLSLSSVILAFSWVNHDTLISLSLPGRIQVWDVMNQSLRFNVKDIPGVFMEGYIYKVWMDPLNYNVYYTSDIGIFCFSLLFV